MNEEKIINFLSLPIKSEWLLWRRVYVHIRFGYFRLYCIHVHSWMHHKRLIHFTFSDLFFWDVILITVEQKYAPTPLHISNCWPSISWQLIKWLFLQVYQLVSSTWLFSRIWLEQGYMNSRWGLFSLINFVLRLNGKRCIFMIVQKANNVFGIQNKWN